MEVGTFRRFNELQQGSTFRRAVAHDLCEALDTVSWIEALGKDSTFLGIRQFVRVSFFLLDDGISTVLLCPLVIPRAFFFLGVC